MTFEELVNFENKNNVWDIKFLEYPLWIHCRESLVSTGMLVDRKVKVPSIINMLKSFFQTIMFLFQQKNYDKVFFLMERAELLEIYNIEKNNKKILFLNPEQEKFYDKEDYISSDFFNLLRFVSRKVAFRIFKKRYHKTVNYLNKIGCTQEIHKYIQVAMGDALFLKFLSLVLSSKNDKIYTGSVIPIGEKFINRLNSFEVQHGVIYAQHIGYIGLPKIKNTLLLYSTRYEEMMKNNGYFGKIEINEYKKDFFEKNSTRYFPIVIYTQPALLMQEGINEFFKIIQPTNCYIQKHPKDYFDYDIEKKYFVSATIPSEVAYPIMYTSSIIENFTLYHRNCYIYNFLNSKTIKKDLEIYMLGTNSVIIVKNNLNNLYLYIQKEIISVM